MAVTEPCPITPTGLSPCLLGLQPSQRKGTALDSPSVGGCASSSCLRAAPPGVQRPVVVRAERLRSPCPWLSDSKLTSRSHSESALFTAQDCSGNVHVPLSHLVSLFAPQALGSFYFLHESLKNIYQFDFKGKTPCHQLPRILLGFLPHDVRPLPMGQASSGPFCPASL